MNNPGQKKKQPNILVFCLDQMRQDWLSLHGHPLVRTPNIDAIGGCGISFTGARSTCPTCIPARQSIMTGLDPWQLNMFCNNGKQPIPSGTPTLAGLLSAAGYQTHAAGKMHCFPARDRLGFHEVENDEEYRILDDGSLHDYERYLRDHGLAHRMTAHGRGPNQYGWAVDPVPEEHSPTHWVADRACTFLERRDPTRPFFLYVSFRQPHPPFLVQPQWWDHYRDSPVPMPVIGDWVGRKPVLHWDILHHKHRSNLWWDHPREIPDNIRAYAAMIAHIDAMIGMTMGALRENGVGDNTWILLVSDHGEMLFDHRGYAKGTPFTASSAIPFLLRPPLGEIQERGLMDSLPRVDRRQPVCLEDVLPTVCDIAGVKPPEGIAGRSVLPFLAPVNETIREYTVMVYIQNFGVTDGKWNYCWFGDTGTELLFDLETDPRECRDLADDPAWRSERDRLRTILHAHLLKHGDRHAGPEGLVVHAPQWNPAYAALKDKGSARGRC